MPQPIIHIDCLSHAYGGRRALDNLSLDIHPNEIFGFLGPNGSGKTTLFRILSTLIPPRSGQVAMLDLDLATQRDDIRRHLGVVFQSPSLDKQLTAEENLRHHGHLYGLRGQPLTERIEQMLARFDLLDRRHEYVQSFSGGLRRRVELAKGLLTRPKILLMDEPSTGLDPAARIDLWRLLQEVRRQDALTILLTTHLMDEADRCDRLAILDRGRLVACGTPAQLKQQIGGDVILLTSRHPATLQETLQQKLGTIPELIDGILRIEIPNAHQFVPQLVEAAPGLIESVSIGKPTLEDVFIHATGRRFDKE
jgi:ABC-2 type transport system ATP-binding protein